MLDNETFKEIHGEIEEKILEAHQYKEEQAVAQRNREKALDALQATSSEPTKDKSNEVDEDESE
jgi:hypothetical protein